MTRFVPKCKPQYQPEYRIKCNRNNLRSVWYFSLFTLLIFSFHLIHHFRLGEEAVSAEMMPYTLLYGFAIAYSLLNMLVLFRLRSLPALQVVANIIEAIFPFMAAAIAVTLSILSAKAGLGITPYAITLMLLSFVLQGMFPVILTFVLMAFIGISVALYLMLPITIASPSIAIAFSTAAACILIAFLTEKMRIREFETLAALNNSNRQLTLLTKQDHLTGLLNRRAIDQALVRELARSERFDHQLSLLMIDIDDFKHVNDKHGHVEGDRILQSLSQMIEKHVRDVDYVGRIGGDEFVVILIETDKSSAMQIAQRMLKAIAAMAQKDNDIVVTVSIGHALSEGESHVALIEKADKALYQAKRAGKNKARSFS